MFDPRTQPGKTQAHKFDPFRKVNRNFEGMNYSARARKTAQNYDSFRNSQGTVDHSIQFRSSHHMKIDDDGVCSPPLWKTKNTPPATGVSPTVYRNLSPNSRSQAIVRGQWELMEMVKNMPESCYELSLKDLVEQPRLDPQAEYCLLDEKSFDFNQSVTMINRQESNKSTEKRSRMMRNERIDNKGLFLKMGFPISVGSTKRKTNNRSGGLNSTCSRVSPKPEALDKSSKTVDFEWWKKKSGSSESESRDSSINSRSNGSQSSSGSISSSHHSCSTRERGSLSCCLPFYHSKRNDQTE